MALELVGRIGILAQVVAIGAAVAEQDMHDRARERAVGAGSQREVHVGDFRGRRAIRIDHDQARVAFAPRTRDVSHDVDLRSRGIAAPHDHEIGLAHFARIGTHLGADTRDPARVDERVADRRLLA